MAKELDENMEIIILKREKHLLLMKVDKLKATHKAELRDKERRIDNLEQMIEKLYGDVMFYSDKLKAKERKVQSLKRKLEEQDDKEKKIEKLEQILEELDGDVIFYSDGLEAKEKEVVRILKRKLEEQDDIQLERKKVLFRVVKYELAKVQIKKLQAKVSELENKLETQDNIISQRLVDENKQVGDSSGVDVD